MSYNAMISFKEIPIESVPEFISELKKASVEKAENIGEAEWPYCPLCKAHVFKENDKFEAVIYGDDEKERARYEKSLEWVSRIFSWRAGYDKEYGVFFLFGIPDALRYLFDSTVCFQNSCDQDYEYEDWGAIHSFQSTYDKWMEMPTDKVLEAIRKDLCYIYGENDDFVDYRMKEMDSEVISYKRREMCYKEIWSHFEPTLEDESSVVYLSMFNSLYDEHLRQKVVKSAFEAAKKEYSSK